MRQRRIKNLDEKIEALSGYMIDGPEKNKGNWKNVYGNDYPLFLEIGCGKGQFIEKCALEHKDRNYIAVEGQNSVAVRAAEKAEKLREESGLSNLYIIRAFVNDTRDIFENGEVSGIYLNFSDPWPKERHKKRRLMHRDRLKGYMDVLKDGGFIEIKTDNVPLFTFAMEEIEALGLYVAAVTDDLHGGDAERGDEDRRRILENAASVTTEYEEKFILIERPIHFVRIEKRQI